jgi:hypothetical protein
MQSTQPKITAPVKNQTGDNETQQKKVRGISKDKTRKRGHRVTGSPTSISTDGIPWYPWDLQQTP